MCNYKCDYCYARTGDNTWGKITSEQVTDDVMNNLSKIEGMKEVFVLGGEPTLHPRYFNIIEGLYKINGVEVLGNITNGMYTEYKTFVDRHRPFMDKFYWNITYHPSQADTTTFKETVSYIHEEGYILNINLLLDVRYKPEINEMFGFCKENDIPVYPSFLFDGDDFVEFTDIQWLIDINIKYKPVRELYYHSVDGVDNYNDLDTFMLGLNGFSGWKCVNNSFSIPVNENRFTQFCTDIDMTVDEINRGSSDVICTHKTCICPSRLGDEKIRITC